MRGRGGGEGIRWGGHCKRRSDLFESSVCGVYRTIPWVGSGEDGDGDSGEDGDGWRLSLDCSMASSTLRSE